MKKLALLLPFVALAACSQEPAAKQAPEATATATAPAAKPSLSAPDQDTFSTLFAEACPKAEKVNTAACKRAGFGSEDVICEYGLGKDKYLRNQATLTPGDGKWVLKDADKVCAQHQDKQG